MLYYTTLYYNILHYTILYYTIVYYTNYMFNALKLQCARRDSLSELFLQGNMPYEQCKGTSLRDFAKL